MKTLARMCYGHPKSLDFLDLSASVVKDRSYPNLLAEVRNQLSEKYKFGVDDDILYNAIAQRQVLNTEKLVSRNKTFESAVADGTYYNNVCPERSERPFITPLFLYCYLQQSDHTILRDAGELMFRREVDSQEVRDGKFGHTPFEDYHAAWEILFRYLNGLKGSKMTIEDIYGEDAMFSTLFDVVEFGMNIQRRFKAEDVNFETFLNRNDDGM